MKMTSILILTSTALLFLSLTPAQSQQEPSPSPDQGGTTQGPGTTQSPDETTGSKQSKAGTEKPKHWTGSLVDVGCMAKAMSTLNAKPEASEPQGATHFMPEASGPVGQLGQGGAGGGAQMQPGQGMPPTQQQQQQQQQPYPGGGQYPPNTGPDTAQSAQMAKASMIDNAAKQCAARDTTQSFGLVLGDGQIMRFDDEGNAKASEALKENPAQPGKKVKAKVTGTMEGSSSVKVASLEIKGKKPSSKTASASPGH